MYPYNYNMNQINRNMYQNNYRMRPQTPTTNDDRFIGGGFVAPLLLGGIAGYAIGNNRPNYYYPPQPYYYPNLYIIHKTTHNIFLLGGVETKEGNTTKIYYTDYATPDQTKVDFRYVDGIKIPDGYHYIGRNDEGNIAIGTSLEEDFSNESETQYVWQKTNEISQDVVLGEGQSLEEYTKSVQKYQGFYINKKTKKIVYLNAN